MFFNNFKHNNIPFKEKIDNCGTIVRLCEIGRTGFSAGRGLGCKMRLKEGAAMALSWRRSEIFKETIVTVLKLHDTDVSPRECRGWEEQKDPRKKNKNKKSFFLCKEAVPLGIWNKILLVLSIQSYCIIMYKDFACNSALYSAAALCSCWVSGSLCSPEWRQRNPWFCHDTRISSSVWWCLGTIASLVLSQCEQHTDIY